jgi:DNA-binding NarL/FixJ family response regulator
MSIHPADELQNETIDVTVVDDHPVVRQGLIALLEHEPDIRVVGEAGSVGQAEAQVESVTPDVMLVDLDLGGEDGLGLLQIIHQRWIGMKTLVVSQHLSRFYARAALNAGASGYVCKEEAADRIVEAIRSVAQGQRYLSPEVGRG